MREDIAKGPPGRKSKLVVKKRKKKWGVSCDKACELCRTPCDNPINPAAIKKKVR